MEKPDPKIYSGCKLCSCVCSLMGGWVVKKKRIRIDEIQERMDLTGLWSLVQYYAILVRRSQSLRRLGSLGNQ